MYEVSKIIYSNSNFMRKSLLLFGAFFGILAVVFGALGAHALENHLDESALKSFETGVRYQMYHALLLLWVGSSSLIQPKFQKTIGVLLVLGILFFSFSIYLLATSAWLELQVSFLGPVTPIGGLLLIVAWLLIFINFFKTKIK